MITISRPVFFVAAALWLSAAVGGRAQTANPSVDQLPAPGAKLLSPDAKAAVEEGVKAMAANKFEEARKAFLKLLSLQPGSPTALTNLGLADFRLGKADEAKDYLQRAVRAQPEDALAWITLGLIYNNEDELDAATAALAQAVYLEPKDPEAHNYFAVVLSRRGWYSAAEDELERAVRLDPNFAEAHFNLALTYLAQDPPAVELARRHYQRALDLGAARDTDVEQKLAAAPPDDKLP